MIIVSSLEDVSMPAMMIKTAKTIAWADSKQDNWTAPARLFQVFQTDTQFQIKENCSAGCPCSEFDCIETTSAPEVTTATVPATTTSPTGNAVLVLSTGTSANKPMIVDFNGWLKSGFYSAKFILFKEMLTKTWHSNMPMEPKLIQDVGQPCTMSFGILVEKITNVR